MLRNLDRWIGLCNGTRLIVENFSRSVIFAKVASGNRTGDLVAIPWIPFISDPDQTGLPFKLICTQFPVNLAFSLTINKSQGQTIGNVVIVLHEPVLSHGQLYVALSRSKSSHTTKVVIPQPENGPPSHTKLPTLFTKRFYHVFIGLDDCSTNCSSLFWAIFTLQLHLIISLCLCIFFLSFIFFLSYTSICLSSWFSPLVFLIWTY